MPVGLRFKAFAKHKLALRDEEKFQFFALRTHTYTPQTQNQSHHSRRAKHVFLTKIANALQG